MANIRLNVNVETSGGDKLRGVSKDLSALEDGFSRSASKAGVLADSVGRTATTMARSASVFGLNADALRAIDDAADIAELGFQNLSTAAAGFNAASVGVVGAGLAIGVAIGNLLNKFEAVRNAADSALAPVAKLWLAIIGEGGTKDAGWAAGELDKVKEAYANVQKNAKEAGVAATGAVKGLAASHREVSVAVDQHAQKMKRLAMEYADAKKDATEFFDTVLKKQNEAMGEDLFTSQAGDMIGGLFDDASIGSVTVSVRDMERAVEGVNQAWEAGEDAISGVTTETAAVKGETFDWSQALQDVNNSMQLLGVSADSTLGSLVGGMTSAASAGDAFSKALEKGATDGQKFTAAMQGLGVAISAFQSKSILGGAAKGAGFGFSIGGPLGALIGAGAGGLIGGLGKLFGGGEIKKLNDIRDAFFDMHGGFEALGQKLAELGDRSLVKRIFDSKTVEQFNAAVAEVDTVLASQAEKQEQVNASVAEGEQVLQSAEAAGSAFSQVMVDGFAQVVAGVAQVAEEIRALVAAMTGIPNISRTVTVDTQYRGGEFPGGAGAVVDVGGGGVGGGGGGGGGGGRRGNREPGFASGIARVPYDMMARVHKGERIVPAAQNKPGAMGNVLNFTMPVSIGAGANVDRAALAQIGAALEKQVRLGYGNLAHEIKRQGSRG